MTELVIPRLSFPEWAEVDRERFDAALAELIGCYHPGTYFIWGIYHTVIIPHDGGVIHIAKIIYDAALTHVYNVYHPGACHIKVGEVTIVS